MKITCFWTSIRLGKQVENVLRVAKNRPSNNNVTHFFSNFKPILYMTDLVKHTDYGKQKYPIDTKKHEGIQGIIKILR